MDYRIAKTAHEIADAWSKVEVLYSAGPLPTPEQAPYLRWVHGHYTGINVFLGQPIISRVRVTTNSGVTALNIGEYVLMMMLAFARHLPRLFEHQSQSSWPANRLDQFMPRELRDLTVGLVGYGSIGREVARLARTFGMRVLATKRDARNLIDHSWQVPGVGDPTGTLAHQIFPSETLHEMLPRCDYVVIATPLTSETRHLIGKNEFRLMKRDAVIINVARGGVLDQSALIEALQEQRIAGAALDVFEHEPLPSESSLWKIPNVVITPHIAGVSPHYVDRAMALLAENMRRYLNGESLLNEVNISTGVKISSS